jgi:hypothetical protein
MSAVHLRAQGNPKRILQGRLSISRLELAPAANIPAVAAIPRLPDGQLVLMRLSLDRLSLSVRDSISREAVVSSLAT